MSGLVQPPQQNHSGADVAATSSRPHDLRPSPRPGVFASARRQSAAIVALAAVLVAFTGPVRAQTGLDGCLYWMDSVATQWSADEWTQQVAHMQRAGLAHIIVVGPANSALQDEPDVMLQATDRLFAACEGTDLHIYLSLYSHPLWYGRWDLDEELTSNRKAVERLAARYAARANFAGWYIPHEIYVMWDRQGRYMKQLYAGLSRLCKQVTPGKRVILSPFFILDREGHLGDFRYAEPREYEEFWHDLLAATEIDIVALQDSGEHLSFYTLEARRPFLGAMKRACERAGKTLWINIETGELHAESYADYERKFGRKTHVNDPKTAAHWRVVSPDKLRAKVRLAREYADTTITWGYREYWDPMRGEAARQAYAAYLAPGTQPASRK